MDLNFEIFMIALLLLSILVVGNFLRDGESNWLEGALLVVRTHALSTSNIPFWLTFKRLFTSLLPLQLGTTPTRM